MVAIIEKGIGLGFSAAVLGGRLLCGEENVELYRIVVGVESVGLFRSFVGGFLHLLLEIGELPLLRHKIYSLQQEAVAMYLETHENVVTLDLQRSCYYQSYSIHKVNIIFLTGLYYKGERSPSYDISTY